jgi:hypothetical protein
MQAMKWKSSKGQNWSLAKVLSVTGIFWGRSPIHQSQIDVKRL